jgi:hypothetical protein
MASVFVGEKCGGKVGKKLGMVRKGGYVGFGQGFMVRGGLSGG